MIRQTKEGVWIIDGDTCIGKFIEESKRLDHDQYLLPKVCQYIKEGDTVIDCGALYGDHSLAYANKVGTYGTVLAFEVNPEAYECLYRNMRDVPQVKIYQVGLGEKNELLTIRQSQNAGASFIDHDETISLPTIRVNALDDMNLSRLDFFKLDVEGYELKALKGARQTLIRLRPKVLMEINKAALERNGASFKAIADFMQALGYSIEDVYPEVEDMDNEPQYDILFAYYSDM